jgi:UDP-N-acetylmuramoyl-L-alanyl-D-glutamate--2,6-diaminopimelate ligase
MTLGGLLEGVKLRKELPAAEAALSVTGLEYDSRRVDKGFVFFAFAGTRENGRRFAPQAMEQGACAVVSEESRPGDFAGPWIEVENARWALATAARTFYRRPDERIHFTGITGTNGKTTTSYVLEAILREAGQKTGLIGTIEYRLAGETRPAPNTTPESLDIMRLAAELERLGGTHLISEVSSHALSLGRVHGFHFHTAVFTNLTQDHLDFHGSMPEYAAAKRLLFAPKEGLTPAWAVLNAEDPFVTFVPLPANTLLYGTGGKAALLGTAGETGQHGTASETGQHGTAGETGRHGTAGETALGAENVRSGFDGLRFELCWEGSRQPIESALVGRFNVLNILAASGAALSYGVSLATIARGVAACRAVPGRFERVDVGQPFLVIVDYAHTDDALRNVIRIARELASVTTGGRVITLFGCGGDRDRSKRPLMGMAAAELSDYVVLTSDNPRSEDPVDIINDTMVGLRRFDTPHRIELDRAKAIRIALGEASKGDVVLLAGKGHETSQIFKDRTIHFDDRESAREALRLFGYKG